MKKFNKNNQGFTIIEVLIVLAIAGLIMMVVFLAVPALQRNSRNTQRKSDVSNLLAAVGEYTANNSGSLPLSGQFSTVFAGVTPKSGYYQDATKLTFTKNTTATAVAFPTDLDSVKIVSYQKCNGNAATNTGATARSIIAEYNIEGSSGASTPQCVES